MLRIKIGNPPLNLTFDYTFSSELDGPTVVKYLDEFTIEENCTVTTSTRCKGLVLFINGDCTINGTLSMTAKGARAVGDNLAIDCSQGEFLVNPSNWENFPHRISAAGGGGGARAYAYAATKSGITGSSSIESSGGGGSGGVRIYNGMNNAYGYSGAGSAGTSYSGGSGGGALCYYVSNVNRGPHYAGNATANGGAGGAGSARRDLGETTQCAGGGAGNNGGSGSSIGCTGYTGGAGTGGLLVLAVKGNLTINGTVQSDGSNGGNATRSGGGGSGGGIVYILHGGNLYNQGTIKANGGAGGSGSAVGGAGGVGLVKISKLTL